MAAWQWVMMATVLHSCGVVHSAQLSDVNGCAGQTQGGNTVHTMTADYENNIMTYYDKSPPPTPPPKPPVKPPVKGKGKSGNGAGHGDTASAGKTANALTEALAKADTMKLTNKAHQAASGVSTPTNKQKAAKDTPCSSSAKAPTTAPPTKAPTKAPTKPRGFWGGVLIENNRTCYSMGHEELALQLKRWFKVLAKASPGYKQQLEAATKKAEETGKPELIAIISAQVDTHPLEQQIAKIRASSCSICRCRTFDATKSNTWLCDLFNSTSNRSICGTALSVAAGQELGLHTMVMPSPTLLPHPCADCCLLARRSDI